MYSKLNIEWQSWIEEKEEEEEEEEAAVEDMIAYPEPGSAIWQAAALSARRAA